MANELDVRWQQRLSNYVRALSRLSAAVALAHRRQLTDLEQQGLIQGFEMVYELAWNVLKDYFVWQGNPNITGSRDAIRAAFAQGLIEDGEGWLEMIQSRNQTAHTYNEVIANAIAERILSRYEALFRAFEIRMAALEARQ
jgi:nucleotidyltransferase substrate binding protein (TIGR01987 family)